MEIVQPNITKAVLDTGPLLNALTLNYVKMASLSRQAGERLLETAFASEFRDSPSRQEAYLLLISKIKTPLITSHVIAEIQGHTKGLKLTGESFRSFWFESCRFLRLQSFDERLVRLLEMSNQASMQEAVYRIGPSDAGLIALARSENCPILTDDRTLASLAWKNGVDCRMAKDLVCFV